MDSFLFFSGSSGPQMQDAQISSSLPPPQHSVLPSTSEHGESPKLSISAKLERRQNNTDDSPCSTFTKADLPRPLHPMNPIIAHFFLVEILAGNQPDKPAMVLLACGLDSDDNSHELRRSNRPVTIIFCCLFCCRLAFRGCPFSWISPSQRG